MSCSKYILTNTGTTQINFNYRRCDDSMWEYQVPLNPNQTKNIWLIDNTFNVSPLFDTNIVLVNEGSFPPIPASPTPTPSNTATIPVTPTNTGTAGVTPTQTPTNTATPTNTGTAGVTPTPTNTGTAGVTPTPTNTGTAGVTPTTTTTLTATPTNTETASTTPTTTPTLTQTPTSTSIPTLQMEIDNFDLNSNYIITGVTFNGTPVTYFGGASDFPLISYPDVNYYGIFTSNATNPITINVGISGNTYIPGATVSVYQPSLGSLFLDATSSVQTLTFSSLTLNYNETFNIQLDSNLLPTPTPTITSTSTPTPEPTTTPTNTETPTTTPTSTSTPTPEPTTTPTNTETPTTTPTNTQTVTPEPTTTQTETPTPTLEVTPTPTPFRNLTISNFNSNGSVISDFSASFSAGWSFTFPINFGDTDNGFISLSSPGDFCFVTITGGTGYLINFYENGILTSGFTGNAPNTETYYLTQSIGDNGLLNIELLDQPTPTPTNTGTPEPTTTPTPTPTPLPSFSVLYIGGSNAQDEAISIKNYLQTTGYNMTYSAVTLDTLYTGDGGITTGNYDTVVMYTTDGVSGSTYSSSLSTALYDYVSSGGNFVSGARLWSSYPSGFNHSELTAFNVRNTLSTIVAGNTIWQDQILVNPITSGLTNTGFGTSVSVNGASGSQMVLSTNSKLITRWGISPNVSMIGFKKVSGATLVSLNAYVANIASFTSSTMNELYGNCVLYSLGYLGDPYTTIEINNSDSSSATTITGVTISGTSGSVSVGQPTTGDGFPLSSGQSNTDFPSTQWGNPVNVIVDIDIPVPPSGTLTLDWGDSSLNSGSLTLTSSGSYIIYGVNVGNLISPTYGFNMVLNYVP